MAQGTNGQPNLGPTLWPQSPNGGVVVQPYEVILTGNTVSMPGATATAQGLSGRGVTDWINVTAAPYYADPTGATDATAALQAALNAVPTGGALVYLPEGTYLCNSSGLTISNPTVILGAGQFITNIVTGSGFSGSAVFSASGVQGCAVRNVRFTNPSSSYSANAAADALKFTNCHELIIEDVRIEYQNGWGVQVLSSGTDSSYSPTLRNVHTYQCNEGIHLKGVSGSGYSSGGWLFGCDVEQCAGGDGLLIEDTDDLDVFGLEGWCLTSSTGYTVHVKGHCQSIRFRGVDLGGFTSGTPQTGNVLIESGTNGTPKDVWFNGGIIEAAATGVSVTAGTEIKFESVRFYQNGGPGISVSGSSQVDVFGCLFDANNFSGGVNYDAVVTSTGIVNFRNCTFFTPSGTSSSEVTAALNPSGTTYVDWNTFSGASAFSATFPKAARWNAGYNPVGHVTSPGLPTTTDAMLNPFGSDAYVTVTGGTITAIAIGGTSTGLTSGSFFLPYNQTITLTYTGTPVWTWFLS